MSASKKNSDHVGLIARFHEFKRGAEQTLRLMVGIPDYENYVEHLAEKHPEAVPMSYEEFFQDRQEKRYGRGTTRCC